MRVRELSAADWPRVSTIYEEGIATGSATFETEVPGWDAWDAGHLDECRLVAEREGRVVGWAALSPVSDRCAYGGVAEASVYVAEEERGRGVGSVLLERLIQASEEAGYWTIQGGLLTENEASLRLLEKHGFRMVGLRERLGRLRGEWRDVWLFERRSGRVGTD